MNEPAKVCLLLTLLLTGLTGFVWAQPVVSNIRVDTEAQRLKITYDLRGNTSQDSVYLQLESRTRGLLKPKTVTGDVGKQITPGLNKVIYWNYVLDGETVDEEIRAIVSVVKPVYPHIKGGPANALVSVFLPGLGNILVQPNHRIGLRPLITVTYGGLLAYGFLQKGKSDQQYNHYLTEPFERNAQPYYDKASLLHKQYLLAIQAAAVVLVADVVYSFIKGTRNVRQARNRHRQVSLNYLSNTPAVGMRFTF